MNAGGAARTAPCRHLRLALVLAPLGLGVASLVVATLVYPGGTWWQPASEGFDWRHNFWCDLLRESSHSGRPNHRASTWASAGLAMMAVGLAAFWTLVATQLAPSRAGAQVVQLAGWGGCLGLGLVAIVPSASAWHDLVIVALAPAGLLALAMSAWWSMTRSTWDVRAASLLAAGLGTWNLAQFVREVSGATLGWPELPLVQRGATAAVLLWVTLLTFRLNRPPSPQRGSSGPRRAPF